MFFYMPTKVYSEKNCVKNHGKEMADLGNKALIVTGRHSSRINGSLADVEALLQGEGVPYEIFDRIEENPSVETVMEAKEIGHLAGADFVIGIGGGSPMDAAKAISFMMKHPEEKAEYLYVKGDDDAYPVVAVPTTCGTGSETTPYAILTRHEKRTKASISHRVFPVIAFCDPDYLKSAGADVLKATAVDAIGHFIESYINVNATEYSKMLCEKGLAMWSEIEDILLEKREAKEEDYEKLMNASSLAGMAISHTGTSLPHGLSYYLTYEDGIPHGKAVGVFLPAYLAAAGTADRVTVLSLLQFRDTPSFGEFIKEVLGDIKISKERKEEAIKGMLQNKAKLTNCPFPVSEEVFETFFD